MKNMKVSMKLISGFLVMIVLAVAIGLTGIFSLTSAADNTALMAERTEIAIIAARMNRNIQAQRAAFRGSAVYHVMNKADQRDSNLADLQTLETDYDALHDEVSVMLITETGLRLMADINAAYVPFSEARDVFEKDILDPSISNEVMIEQLDVVASTVAPLANSVAALVDFADELTTQMAEEAAATASRTTFILAAILVAAVVISISLALYISGLISKPLAVLTAFMKKASATGDIALRPEDIQVIANYSKRQDEIGQTIAASAAFVNRINEVSDVLHTISDGDLTAELHPLSEQDALGTSLYKMTTNLNEMFGNINMSSVQVSTGAGQVADSAQALAQGATEQAATVQELSSAVSEIAERTKANAVKAGQASQLAGSIKGIAEKGSRQMEEMMSAVKEINEASQSIGKVIKAIDDIAFQTNILALNAAVEAARAGQHGKGFAVVADEVRSLAAKSAEAAKDTESLIAESIERAQLGVRIAEGTSDSLSEIVTGINESSLLVTEIADSSEEQSLAIAQINNGIDQVAQVVQQNSATAEQSAAASQEMSGQSTMLQELISQFKTKAGTNISQTIKPVRTDTTAPSGAGGFALYSSNKGAGKY